jgi:hypothetical protein
MSYVAQTPTSSDNLQIHTALPLLGVMILTFGMFIIFFHIFSD